MSMSVGIVGCGTAGQAAAIFLAQAGHDVCVFERAAQLAPVGAGLLVQPTGVHVLTQLGVVDELQTLAAPVRRLHGTTAEGRTVLDLDYADLQIDLCGLGLQRAAISASLRRAMDGAGAEPRLGVGIERIEEGATTLIDDGGARHGPFDLVIVADGARSALRAQRPRLVRRDRDYSWGALWFIGDDVGGVYGDVLRQVYRGAHTMIGFLPSGRVEGADRGRVSLFWGMRAREWTDSGGFDLEAWKRRVRALTPLADPLLEQIAAPEQIVFAPYRDAILRRSFEGRVVFIGDAAHAMSPQLGQGVNLALLDAAGLADQLAAARPLQESLREFDRARRRHVAFYQRASRWLTPFFQSDVTLAGWARDVAFGRLCRFGPTRRELLRTLAGVKTGLLTSCADPLELSGRACPRR